MTSRVPRAIDGGQEWLRALVRDFGELVHWAKEQADIFTDSTKAAAKSTESFTRRWSKRLMVGSTSDDLLERLALLVKEHADHQKGPASLQDDERFWALIEKLQGQRRMT